MHLRPCSACSRHVRLVATACPFCGVALTPMQPQFARPRAFTRAAIFAAAVAGCSDHSHPPAAKGSAAMQGSDDLEQMLDEQPKTADHPAPPADAAVDAGEAVAVTPDAGVDPQVAEKKRADERLRQLKRRREEERLRQQQQQQLEEVHQLDHIQQAKPYGAPPARRRVV